MKGYLAGFYGQGLVWGLPWLGWATSNGITRMVNRAKREFDIDGACYNFDQLAAADLAISPHRYIGEPIATLSYSLGVTGATAYQLTHKVNLTLCIAGSKLGRDYNISKQNCARSILWRGDGVMSSWGANAGFDQIHDVHGVPHLWMDFTQEVQDGVFLELQRLFK